MTRFLNRKFFSVGISLVIVAAMLLSGCSPAPTQPPAAPAQPQPTSAPAQPQPTSAPAQPQPTTAPQAPAATAAPTSHTLTIAVSADLAGWDPTTSIYWLANEIIINTYDTLVDLGPGKDAAGNPVRDINNVVPGLAESFTADSTSKVFTFKLRQNAKFVNGDPVTAQTVKDSFARVITTSGLAQFLLTGVADVTKPDQMTIVDPQTIQFTLPTSNPLFLKVMEEMNMAIVDVNAIKTKGGSDADSQNKWAAANTNGSGPYYVDNYQPGVQVVLKTNPNYWGNKPYYDTVVYKVVPDVENRVLLLKNGDVDIAYEVPLKDISSLQADPNLKTFAIPTLGTLFFWIGSQSQPWNNLKLRQAIGYAIPYNDIIQNVTYGLAKPATSWMPAGLEGHVDVAPTYDLQKAQSLMTEAGYPGGKGLPTAIFYNQTGNAETEQVAVYIQAALAKIGINMQIQDVAMAAMSDKLNAHPKDLFAFNFWIPYVPDSGYSLYWTYKTATSGCCNYASFSNKQVDDTIASIMTETDPTKRDAEIQQVQQLVSQNPPDFPIYHPTWNLSMQKKVTGYSYYPDTLLRFAQFSGQ